MKKYYAMLGMSALMMESVSQNNSDTISKNPESEKDRRKAQYQQELNDEWMISEYKLIQQKQSKLSANERRKIVIICEKKFTPEQLK